MSANTSETISSSSDANRSVDSSNAENLWVIRGFESGGAEAAKVDPNYSNRRGYNPSFLPGLIVPLPQLSAAQRRVTARVRGIGESTDPFELKYEHFSVVLNADRRMPFFSACNIDGDRLIGIDRTSGQPRSESAEASEKWTVDPRVPEDAQLNDALYSRLRNYFPKSAGFFARGHMTRREDPNWGTINQAVRANADTFHHPNGCPQVQDFNGKQQYWQGIENYILNAAELSQLRVTVITGPVFDDDDDLPFEDILIPRRFWKIVVRIEDGQPIVFAVMADQDEFIKALQRARVEALSSRPESIWDWPRKLSTEYKSTVDEVSRLTGLGFGDLSRYDVFAARPENMDKPVRRRGDLAAALPRSRGQFGRYESIGDFLAEYESQLEAPAESREEEGAERRRRKPRVPVAKKRAVVEVEAEVVRVFPDDTSGAKHQQFAVKLTNVVSVDAAAKGDVQQAVGGGEQVRVAVRFGDNRGLATRVPGVLVGATLRMKGEWIPAEKAYSIGGERLAVLHFTHDPLGFICNEAECYS